MVKPGASLRTRLITPAMASEPYCAEAPSRRTSIRSMALRGMAFISVPAVPRPTVSSTCSNALLCRRFPLTNTSTWSGPSPRSVAGRTESVPSVIAELWKLNEGESICRARPVSTWPELRNRSPSTSSTGTGDSRGSRPSIRLPTTWTSSAMTSSWRLIVINPVDWPVVREAFCRFGALTDTSCGPSPSWQKLAIPESSVGWLEFPIATVAFGTAAPDGSTTWILKQFCAEAD